MPPKIFSSFAMLKLLENSHLQSLNSYKTMNYLELVRMFLLYLFIDMCPRTLVTSNRLRLEEYLNDYCFT